MYTPGEHATHPGRGGGGLIINPYISKEPGLVQNVNKARLTSGWACLDNLGDVNTHQQGRVRPSTTLDSCVKSLRGIAGNYQSAMATRWKRCKVLRAEEQKKQQAVAAKPSSGSMCVCLLLCHGFSTATTLSESSYLRRPPAVWVCVEQQISRTGAERASSLPSIPHIQPPCSAACPRPIFKKQ